MRRSIFVPLTVILFIFINESFAAVDWSSISTASQMSAVPAAEFATMTSSDVASLHSTACAGFLAEQVAQIPSRAFSGFSSNCMQNFPAAAAVNVTSAQLSSIPYDTGCGGITISWLLALPLSSVSGWSASCASRLYSDAFRAITPEFLMAISPGTFSGFSSSQIGNIAASAFTNISASQVSYLGTNCGGITLDQFASMSSPVFSSITSDCINSLSSWVWSGVTVDKFAQLSNSALGSFSREAAGHLSSGVVQSITPNQIYYFRGEACGGLDPSAASLMSISTWKSMPSSCGSRINSLTYGYLDASRLAVLSDSVCGSLDKYRISSINASLMSSLSDSCFGSFGDDCGLTPQQFMAVPASKFAYLRASCGGTLSSECWKHVTVEQFSQLSSVLGQLSEYATSVLPVEVLQSITPQQIGYFSGIPCRGFPTSFFSLITVESWAQLTSSCLDYISSESFKYLDAPHIAATPSRLCESFGSYATAAINASLINYFTDSCFGALRTCDRITDEQFTNIEGRRFALFSTKCLTGISSSLWAKVSLEQFSNMTSGLNALSSYGTASLPSEIVASITPSQISSFSYEACSGFSPEPLSRMSVATWQGMPSSCLAKLQSNALAYLDASRLAVLSSTDCGALSSYKLGHINATYIGALTDSCISSLDENCQGFTAEQLAGLRVSAFPKLSRSCISHSPSSSWIKVSAEQITYVSADQCAKFRYILGDLNPPTYAGFTAACFFSIPSDGCSDISRESVSFMPPALFSSMTADCLRKLKNADGIQPQQAPLIPADVIPSFGSYFSLLSTSAMAAMRLEQLARVTSDMIKQSSLVDLWSASTLNTPKTVVSEFKRNISGDPFFQSISVQFPAETDASFASWMRLYFAKANESSYSLTFWGNVPDYSLSGIPVAHVNLISPQIWANTSSNQASYLTKDVTGAMSTVQFTALQPKAIGSLATNCWDSVSPDTIQALSPLQVARIPADGFRAMFCYQLGAFTDSQFVNSSDVLIKVFENAKRPCSFPPVEPAQPVPVSTPSQAKSPMSLEPETQPVNQPEPTTAPVESPSSSNLNKAPTQPEPPLSALTITLIVVISVLVATIIILVAAYFLRLRKQAFNYEVLQIDPSA